MRFLTKFFLVFGICVWMGEARAELDVSLLNPLSYTKSVVLICAEVGGKCDTNKLCTGVIVAPTKVLTLCPNSFFDEQSERNKIRVIAETNGGNASSFSVNSQTGQVNYRDYLQNLLSLNIASIPKNIVQRPGTNPSLFVFGLSSVNTIVNLFTNQVPTASTEFAPLLLTLSSSFSPDVLLASLSSRTGPGGLKIVSFESPGKEAVSRKLSGRFNFSLVSTTSFSVSPPAGPIFISYPSKAGVAFSLDAGRAEVIGLSRGSTNSILPIASIKTNLSQALKLPELKLPEVVVGSELPIMGIIDTVQSGPGDTRIYNLRNVANFAFPTDPIPTNQVVRVSVSSSLSGSFCSSGNELPCLNNLFNYCLSFGGITKTGEAQYSAQSLGGCPRNPVDSIGYVHYRQNSNGTKFIGYNYLRSSVLTRRTGNSPEVTLNSGFSPSPIFNTETIPVAGDWDGDGIRTMGFYDYRIGQFYLYNSNYTGGKYMIVQFEPSIYCRSSKFACTPLIGHWNKEKPLLDSSTKEYNALSETVGLFDRGRYYLASPLPEAGGSAIQLGVAKDFLFENPNYTAVAGDWDGDGVDSIGAVDTLPGSNEPQQWYLVNNVDNLSSVVNVRFGFRGWKPIAGDWDADGKSSPGNFDPTSNKFWLTNSISTNPGVNYQFSYGRTGGDPTISMPLIPLAGPFY